MIGIYGGTFDPVHFGHLRPALEVYEQLNLHQLRFIPCYQPPHRDMPLADARQRESMLSAALDDDTPGLMVDDREIRRGGVSYMVDTLASLREELGQEALCLVLGMDAFLQLPGWHRWQELPDLAHLVVMHRPGWEAEAGVGQMDAEIRALWQDRLVEDSGLLKDSPAGCILHLAVTQLDISATHIRDMIAAGKSPRFLIPDPVWRLIRQYGLYNVNSREN